MKPRLLLALLGLLGAVLSAADDAAVIADPHLVDLPERRSQLAWEELFDPSANWPARQVGWLSLNTGERLSLLWAARLLYRGEPWLRRAGETSSLRRWRAMDREVKQMVLRDIRWRRDPAWLPLLRAFLEREDADPGLAVSALVDAWLIAPREGILLASRIADPNHSRALPSSGLPGARARALALLLDAAGPGNPLTRGGLEHALLRSSGAERNAALALLPDGSAPDLVGQVLLKLAEDWRAARLDDDATAGAVLACTRLGTTIPEQVARTLAELAATAPREMSCAAAAALAHAVTWQTAVDPAPLLARLVREDDAAVRHALSLVLLRLTPTKLGELGRKAGAWELLAKHRLRLQDWAWQQYVR